MGFSSHNYTLTDHKLYSTQDGATSATQPELRRAHAVVSDLCRIVYQLNDHMGHEQLHLLSYS